MPTLKDITIEVLKNIPPSSSLEEIMYKINLAAHVMEGIKDADPGNVISTNELLKRIDSWTQRPLVTEVMHKPNFNVFSL